MIAAVCSPYIPLILNDMDLRAKGGGILTGGSDRQRIITAAVIHQKELPVGPGLLFYTMNSIRNVGRGVVHWYNDRDEAL